MRTLSLSSQQGQHQPLRWTEKQRQELHGLSFTFHVGYNDALNDYQSKVIPFCTKHADKFGNVMPTYEAYIDHVTTIMSRGFRDCNSQPRLVPMLDCINTHKHSHINAYVSWSRDNTVSLYSAKQIDSETDILIAYDNIGGTNVWLERYGFVTDEPSEDDWVEIPVHLIAQICADVAPNNDKKDKTSPRKRHKSTHEHNDDHVNSNTHVTQHLRHDALDDSNRDNNMNNVGNEIDDDQEDDDDDDDDDGNNDDDIRILHLLDEIDEEYYRIDSSAIIPLRMKKMIAAILGYYSTEELIEHNDNVNKHNEILTDIIITSAPLIVDDETERLIHRCCYLIMLARLSDYQVENVADNDRRLISLQKLYYPHTDERVWSDDHWRLRLALIAVKHEQTILTECLRRMAAILNDKSVST